MKFEVNEETGIIMVVMETLKSKLPSIYPLPNQLEKILQGVKKTQEKIVNRQIQEIQDSKNDPIRGFTTPPTMIQKNDRIFYGDQSWTLEEIDENQKIVSVFVSEVKTSAMLIDALGENHVENGNDDAMKANLRLIRAYKMITGKDIKDL